MSALKENNLVCFYNRIDCFVRFCPYDLLDNEHLVVYILNAKH